MIATHCPCCWNVTPGPTQFPPILSSLLYSIYFPLLLIIPIIIEFPHWSLLSPVLASTHASPQSLRLLASCMMQPLLPQPPFFSTCTLATICQLAVPQHNAKEQGRHWPLLTTWSIITFLLCRVSGNWLYHALLIFFKVPKCNLMFAIAFLKFIISPLY